MAVEDFTRGLKTERMTDLALAFKKTGAMLAAIEMELFTHISNGAGSAEDLGPSMGNEAEKADRLLTACERNPELRVMVMEQTNVIVVAREFIAKHGLEDDKTGPLDPAFVNLFGVRRGRYQAVSIPAPNGSNSLPRRATPMPRRVSSHRTNWA